MRPCIFFLLFLCIVIREYTKEDNFRLYMNDIGLLISTYDYELKNVLLRDGVLEKKPDNLILRASKGGLYESLAADILMKKGKSFHFSGMTPARSNWNFSLKTPMGSYRWRSRREETPQPPLTASLSRTTFHTAISCRRRMSAQRGKRSLSHSIC